MCLAIVFQAAILHGFVMALSHVMQYDPRLFVTRHREAQAISTACYWHVRTSTRVADVAEIAQLGFRRIDLFHAGAARAGESGA